MSALHFKPITLESKDIITSFLSVEQYSISDITFGNLYLWKHARSITYAIYQQSLLIKTCYPKQMPYFFFPIGQGDKQEALLALHKYATHEGFPLVFASLEASHLPILQSIFPHASITPTPNHFDYIYDVSELLTLSGRKFHKKKNHLNAFLQRYIYQVEHISKYNSHEIIHTATTWLNSHPKKTRALEIEHEGICVALRDFHKLNLQGILIRAKEKHISQSTPSYIQPSSHESLTANIHLSLDTNVTNIDAINAASTSSITSSNANMAMTSSASSMSSSTLDSAPIIAFSFGELINSTMAVIHIEKASPNIIGAYQIINQQLLHHCFADIRYVNREEDLGIPGLRQAKRGYNPIFLVEKFHASI